MKDVIEVQNLSKMYRLGQFNTGALSQDIHRWFALARGKEDPFLKVGEKNDRTSKGQSNVVWSLRDLNFRVQEGDTVGIIGKNGAGKSTLLKLLSRVTSPTTGTIRTKGRIASLLEVGTGFHPELTGRENIFLNGAILGMKKSEIKEQLDAIVDFAGIERYLDTPVKRYSSGMFVRLGFAVAAHLRSEILIVDEVLAVGDSEFQKKCLGKMGEINKGEGRAILFVSHNMASIKSLCEKGILLTNGEIKLVSDRVEESISEYFKGTKEGKVLEPLIWTGKQKGYEYLNISKVQIIQPGATGSVLNREEPLEIVIDVDIEEKDRKLEICAVIKDYMENPVFVSQNTDLDEENWPELSIGKNSLRFEIPANLLNHGDYTLNINAYLFREKVLYDEKSNAPRIPFKVSGKFSESPYWTFKREGLIAPIIRWYST